MLTIAADALPRTDLTCLAFRVAFCETFERIVLAQQIELSGEWLFGYLTEVPFLRQVVPHVQLDILLETWARHQEEEPRQATLLDESVIYSVAETTARLVRHDPRTVERFAANSPSPLDLAPSESLARQLQELHLNFCPGGNYLLISQFLDLPPREARLLKREFGITPDNCEPMFDAIGRWRLRPDFMSRAESLLSPSECNTLRSTLDRLGCGI